MNVKFLVSYRKYLVQKAQDFSIRDLSSSSGLGFLVFVILTSFILWPILGHSTLPDISQDNDQIVENFQKQLVLYEKAYQKELASQQHELSDLAREMNQDVDKKFKSKSEREKEKPMVRAMMRSAVLVIALVGLFLVWMTKKTRKKSN